MTRPLTETIVRVRSLPTERTPQRLDPLGVQSAWLLVPLLGVVAVGYAVASPLWHRDQLRNPVLAVAAIALLALVAVVAILRTHPGLAPIGRWSHLAIVGFALVSACLFQSAVWGRNERIQDDWGQIAVALLLVAMPLYRPIAEVLVVAVVCALVLGTGAALQAPSLAIATSPLVYATVAATPVLALACGGAGYAWTMTGETLRWREQARGGQARLDGELRRPVQVVQREWTRILSRSEAVNIIADSAIFRRPRSNCCNCCSTTWLIDMVACIIRSSEAATAASACGGAT